jgi:hypothetical protein
VKDRNYEIKSINMKNKHLFVNRGERMTVTKTTCKGLLFMPLYLHILEFSLLDDQVKYKSKINNK